MPPKTATKKKAAPPGPHGRLGLAWAVVTLAAAAGPRPVLAAWLAPQAALAALQLARAAQRHGRAAHPHLAAAGAAASCLAAAAGLWAVTAVLVAVPVAAAAWAGGSRRPAPPSARAVDTFTVATVAGMAAGSLVLVRGLGFTEAAVLVLLAGAYDTGAYLVGTGAATKWEGPIAGIAAVAAVDLSVAALLVPPFRGASPWLAGAAVAVAAPIGTALARALAPKGGVSSALRRLDSLLVAGPAYAAVVAVAL